MKRVVMASKPGTLRSSQIKGLPSNEVTPSIPTQHASKTCYFVCMQNIQILCAFVAVWFVPEIF